MVTIIKKNEILALRQDIAVIKHILMNEGKLKPAAKAGLAKARKQPLLSYTALEEL